VATLADAIGKAKSDTVNHTKNVVRGSVKQAERGLKGAVGSVVNSAKNAATQAAAGAVNAGLAGVIGAATDIVTGNPADAAQRIFDIPGNVAGAVGSVLGVASGSILSGPGGGMSRMSDNGGILEGNSFYGALARSDPMQSISWYAQVPVITSAYGTMGLPWYFIQEATVPFRQFDQVSIFREGRTKHYAGRYSLDSLRLSFYMDSSGLTMRYLRGWEAAILQPTDRINVMTQGGGFMPPNQYKKDIYVFLLDPIRQAIACLQYIECWPTNLDQLQLESASSNQLVANVNFSVGDVLVVDMEVSRTTIEGILGAANPLGNIITTATDVVTERARQAVGGLAGAIGDSLRMF